MSQESAEIFRLEVAASGLATLCFDLPGSRVNLFTRAALEELGERLAELRERDDIDCLVLLSAKPDSFSHGADVTLIGALDDAEEGARGARAGQDLFRSWEQLPFPTIAAIHSTSMGGGTELALASSFRLLSDRADLRIGLPEVRLGILPGWGGCYRLPRVVGLSAALEVILAGKSLSGDRALELGLADALLPEHGFFHHVRDFALEVIHGRRPERGERDLRDLLLESNPLGRRIVFDQARKKTLARSGGKYPAPLRAIEVIRLGLEEGRAAGLEAEARELGDLAAGSVSKNLQHVFALTQAAKAEATPALAPSAVGVVGAGLMGGAIAHQIAVAGGISVRLQDPHREALVRGMSEASKLVYNRMKRRRISRPEARQAMARIQPTRQLEGFRHLGLVIEAAPEDLALKRRLFAELEAKITPDAVLASNTSSLSIDAIADGLERPQRALGLHFFNPVQRIPLVEVVAGKHTDAASLERATALVRALGKTPIAVRDRPGFLVNRLLIFYMVEALWLLTDGWTVEAVDELMLEWGWPMGPFALLDRVGLDIAVAVAGHLEDAYPDRVSMPPLAWDRAFLEPGHLGRKSGQGFFRRAGGGKATVVPEVYERLGLGPRQRALDRDQARDRLIYPMVNEAALCLAEEVVRGPQALDLAMILGAGFPPFRGGLCRWADQQGLATVARALERVASSVGPRFAPSEALLEAAARGGFTSD